MEGDWWKEIGGSDGWKGVCGRGWVEATGGGGWKEVCGRGAELPLNLEEVHLWSLRISLISQWSSSELGLEVAPMVQQPLTSLTVQAGDTATLTCRVCGRPRPQVQWRYRDSQVIVQGHNPRVLMMYNEEGLATLQVLGLMFSS